MDKKLSSIPSAFVPLQYMNDPETEDLIFGDRLKSGMVVLLEDTLLRADPDRYGTSDTHDQIRIQETARWCRIVDIRYSGNMVTMICEYNDGSKRLRSYNISFAWFVKLASMPADV